MNNSNLPDDFANVMVTYNKVFGTGPYGDTKETRTITKLGFYSDGKFRVPPAWAKVRMGSNMVLLPDGFGGDHMSPDRIIKWEPAKQD